jgi:hypothetical protein
MDFNLLVVDIVLWRCPSNLLVVSPCIRRTGGTKKQPNEPKYVVKSNDYFQYQPKRGTIIRSADQRDHPLLHYLLGTPPRHRHRNRNRPN